MLTREKWIERERTARKQTMIGFVCSYRGPVTVKECITCWNSDDALRLQHYGNRDLCRERHKVKS